MLSGSWSGKRSDKSLLLKRSIGMRIKGLRMAYRRPHRWVSA